MPSQTTLQENIRAPIDGTEWVRLSTGSYPTGMNFRGQLSSIFGSLVVAAGPVNSVQFNNPLGSFAGTFDFIWTTGTSTRAAPLGLRIGGATLSGGIYTPGTSEHMAIGNFGVIDNPVFAPGDPVNQGLVGSSVPIINVNNHFIVNDLPEYSGVSVKNGMTFTGAGTSQGYLGIDVDCSINSDSTGVFAEAVGAHIQMSNFGSGNIQTELGVLCFANNAGPIQGLIGGEFVAQNNVGGSLTSNMIGGSFAAIQSATSPNQTIGGWFRAIMQNTTPLAMAIKAENLVLATTTEARTIWVKQPTVTVLGFTNGYGLYIDDHSAAAIGSTNIGENIHSFGTQSINYFEGYDITKARLVANLAAPSAYLAGARAFVTDSNLAMAGNFGAVVAGLGVNAVPVVCDGTNWRIG